MRVGKPGRNIYETLGGIVDGLEKEEMKGEARPASWKILLAFAIIYFVWGSTFLAIRIGVHEVPPFLLAAVPLFYRRPCPLRLVASQGHSGAQPAGVGLGFGDWGR